MAEREVIQSFGVTHQSLIKLFHFVEFIALGSPFFAEILVIIFFDLLRPVCQLSCVGKTNS